MLETDSIKTYTERGQDNLLKKEIEDLKRIKMIADEPLVTDEKRVEIIMINTDWDASITSRAIKDIIEHTKYPYKLTIYNNTLNSKHGTCNTSKIWNKLIRESTCGYVMLIDNDAFVQNDGWLGAMVEALETNDNVLAIGPVAGGSSVTTCQDMKHVNRPAFRIDGHISGYCMLFKRDIVDRYRYFDEDFLFYGQESDWIQEIIDSRKFYVYVCPRAYVKHGDDTGVSISSVKQEKFDRRLESEYSRALFQKKIDERNRVSN